MRLRPNHELIFVHRLPQWSESSCGKPSSFHSHYLPLGLFGRVCCPRSFHRCWVGAVGGMMGGRLVGGSSIFFTSARSAAMSALAETTDAAAAPSEAPAATTTPKRRSSSCAALQGATPEEVKSLSHHFGVVVRSRSSDARGLLSRRHRFFNSVVCPCPSPLYCVRSSDRHFFLPLQPTLETLARTRLCK